MHFTMKTDEPSDNPEVNVEDNSADQQDFCEPLQSATFSALHTNQGMSEQGGLSKLGGSHDSEESPIENGTTVNLARAFRNRKEKRQYWKIAMRSLAKSVELQDMPLGQALYMKKYMEHPPGCSFLGAKATTATVLIGKQATVGTPIIIDSGSDITLISIKLFRHFQSLQK